MAWYDDKFIIYHSVHCPTGLWYLGFKEQMVLVKPNLLISQTKLICGL